MDRWEIFVLRLGSFANLFADSCFFGRFECTCFCASFNDILSLKRYAVFTNSYFPLSQIHSFDLQPDKVSQVHTYCRPCLKYHVHSIAKLQSFTKILRLHRFSAPSPDKAMLWVWWEDFLEWKWSFGNNIALSGEGAEILLPFHKEQICFHKNEQKIRPLGVGLNIFCEGL